ncbi:hypothetical protein HWV62_2958 [Athelia sp. TMB]|nr:hypothetical protein HWV62_2958 [Athelia sp. TMB]
MSKTDVGWSRKFSETMNRPGQPPQRPPSLGPNPGLAGPFRPGPYPQYGLPPRNVNVLQGGFPPGVQPRAPSQQQPQNMLPSPSPGLYQQQRNPGSFPFNGLGHQATGQQQQHQAASLQQHSGAHQANGTSTGLPPHLTQNAATPSLSGTAPSASASEVGLDPNDFPALGSAPSNSASNGNSGAAASYASQAGTGVPPGTGPAAGGAVGGGNGAQTRDFTPDDFPALGGQPQTSSQSADHSHPPGLNGFPQTEQSTQHRQNLLGSIQQPTTPGMLNIGAQARSVHPGFQQQTQAEAEKQRSNYSLKMNQATHAAWNSPNANPGSQAQLGTGVYPTSSTPNQTLNQTNGNHSQNTTNPAQTAQTTAQSHSHLNPGVPSTNSFVQSHAPGAITNASGPNALGSTTATGNPPYIPNGLNGPASQETQNQHPQTPAQQVLMSAADRWGLLGLLAMIKNAGAELDGGLSSVGTDLGTMGLDVGFTGNLYSTFITPWADQSAAHTVEPDYHLPACYNVQPPPPGPSKAAAFSDETLFFMFYSSPRDALQEIAAQELFNRNWRYHKELRHWITKETGTSPSQKVQGGEQGTYTFWDPENWQKERKDMTVLYADLEEKTLPAFLPGPGLVPSHAAHPQNQTLAQGPAQQQVQQPQRAGIQMGMTSL